MMGMPKRRSKRLQSSFCSLVTLTVRLLYFAMSSSEAPLCSTSSFSDMCSHIMMVHGLLAPAKSSPGNWMPLPPRGAAALLDACAAHFCSLLGQEVVTQGIDAHATNKAG